jgi:hypothetical protein
MVAQLSWVRPLPVVDVGESGFVQRRWEVCMGVSLMGTNGREEVLDR